MLDQPTVALPAAAPEARDVSPGVGAAGAPPARAPSSSWALRALLAVAIVLLLQLGKPLFLPIAIAVAFTFVLSAPVRRLRRIGIPEAIGAGLVVAAVLGALAMIVSTVASPAADWWDRAPATVRQLVDSADRLRSSVLGGTPAPRRTRQAAAVQPSPIADRIASEGVSFTRVVLGQMFSFALEAAATVILLYFLLASEHWLLSRTVEAVPRRRTRALVVGGVRQAQREIGLYLGTMTLINIGLGLLTATAMALIGLPNPVLWGAVAALLNYVPYLGPALMTGLLLLAGSMTFGTDAQLFAPPAAFVAFHAIESNLVTPWVVGRRLRLAPLSVFLSVMLLGWLWGIAGAFVAVPVLLGVRTVFKRSRRFKLACRYLEGDASPAPSLRVLLRSRRRLPRAEGGA
ncbi:MAG TPA: AI-2E family transporter [Albitalea sp.]|nr:AI-2E family transporter [Albitalea sp.]